MPLHILALLVIVGLAAIISAIHFSGGSRAVAPMTAEQAMQRFCEDHQMTHMTECILAEDGRSAIVFSDLAQEVGLVLQLGDKLVTRKLSADLLSQVDDSPDGLALKLNDFTLPTVLVRLSSAAAKEKCLKLFEALDGETSHA